MNIKKLIYLSIYMISVNCFAVKQEKTKPVSTCSLCKVHAKQQTPLKQVVKAQPAGIKNTVPLIVKSKEVSAKDAGQILVSIENMTSNKVLDVSITSNNAIELIRNTPPGESSGSSISGDTVTDIHCTLQDGSQIALSGAPLPFSAGSVRIKAHGSGEPYVCECSHS